MNSSEIIATAMRDLETGDSPAKRTLAARLLGSARSRSAVPQLIVALSDAEPQVRSAVVEALGQVGDAAAIAPMNELLAHETDPLVRLSTILNAIDQIRSSGAASKPDITSAVPDTPELKEREGFSLFRDADLRTALAKLDFALEDDASEPSRASDSVETLQSDIAPSPASVVPDQSHLERKEEEEPLGDIYRRAAEERKLIDESRRRSQEEATRRVAEERLRLAAEEEALDRLTEELSRRRTDVEAALLVAEGESRQLKEREE